MKFRFDGFALGIITAAVSLPICAAIIYIEFDSLKQALRHPRDHPLIYQHALGTVALALFVVVVAIISLVARRHQRQKSNDPSDSR